MSPSKAAVAQTSNINSSSVMTHILAQNDRLLRSAAEVAQTQDKTQRIVRLHSDGGRVYVAQTEQELQLLLIGAGFVIVLTSCHKHEL
jgi:hypothetical protein